MGNSAPRVAALAFFVIASLLGHAVCFYLFQIIYPPTVALLPPPARVTLITSDSEEGRTLLRWIEAEDPALAFTTLRSPENKLRSLPKIAHIPSYTTNELILKQPPPLTVDRRPPSSQPPGRVPSLERPVLPNPEKIPTSVSFSEEFTSLGTPAFVAPKFAASSNEPPQNVPFRVAVSPAGEIRYCFPLGSSGDSALDQQAHDFIMLTRFPGADKSQTRDEKLTWGVATVNWGNDVALPGQTGSVKTKSPN